MLRRDKGSSSTLGDIELLERPDFTETYYSIISIVKRHFRANLVIMACSTALGLLYLFITPSSFTATGILVSDTHKHQLSQQRQQSVMGDNPSDPQAIPTEVEILRSPKVITSVIRELGLAKDPEFVGNGGLFGYVPELFVGLWGARKPSELEL